MQLVAYGAQDIYLTGNPQITFFKVVYRRHTNFSMESIQQTWNGNAGGTGGRCTATISRNGDLVHKLYIQIDSGDVNASFATSNPGAHWITDVSVEIGGQTIDRQRGSWMETWSELTERNETAHVAGYQNACDVTASGPSTTGMDHGTLFQRTTGMGGVYEIVGREAAGAAYQELFNVQRYVYVPLQFWFCRNPGLALPLIALQYHEVKIVLNHALGQVWTGGSSGSATQALWADYIYLDTDERRRFAQVSHEYLIEQIQHQTGSVSSNSTTLNFNHPVKELIWTGEWDTSYNSGGGMNKPLPNGSNTYILKLNGHDRFAARPTSYFTKSQVLQYHSGPGGLNASRAVAEEASASAVSPFNDSIACYSFALKPEEHQPSGTCNFSRIDSAVLTGTTAAALEIYAVNYNVLRIMSGMGGLAYSN